MSIACTSTPEEDRAMLKATVKRGAIVPLEPLPPEWHEGAALEIELVEAPAIEKLV
jgi:hypothetical protein